MEIMLIIGSIALMLRGFGVLAERLANAYSTFNAARLAQARFELEKKEARGRDRPPVEAGDKRGT